MAPQGQGKGKDHVKREMAKHTNPKDRFMTFANGVLDQAKELVSGNATEEEQIAAIDGLRGQLDEAWDDIQHGGGGKK